MIWRMVDTWEGEAAKEPPRGDAAAALVALRMFGTGCNRGRPSTAATASTSCARYGRTCTASAASATTSAVPAIWLAAL
eukprot:scaffold38058_cov99-Phaeocystis_antarctica.AAC.1